MENFSTYQIAGANGILCKKSYIHFSLPFLLAVLRIFSTGKQFASTKRFKKPYIRVSPQNEGIAPVNFGSGFRKHLIKLFPTHHFDALDRYAFCLQALLQNFASFRLEIKEPEHSEQVCSEKCSSFRCSLRFLLAILRQSDKWQYLRK